jgi:hypothetical protein
MKTKLATFPLDLVLSCPVAQEKLQACEHPEAVALSTRFRGRDSLMQSFTATPETSPEVAPTEHWEGGKGTVRSDE